jgi:hypothetical protein
MTAAPTRHANDAKIVTLTMNPALDITMTTDVVVASTRTAAALFVTTRAAVASTSLGLHMFSVRLCRPCLLPVARTAT